VSEATEVTEAVFGKMEEYFDAAKQVIETYGGDVADLGLNVLRIEAGAMLVLPLIAMVFLLSVVKYIKRVNIWGFSADNNCDAPAVIVPLVVDAIVVFTVYKVFSIWAWVGLFYPELYAVHKFILN